MRTVILLGVLLVGIAGGVTLQQLMPHALGERMNQAPKPDSGEAAKKDKKLVAIDPDIAETLGIETTTAGPGVLASDIRLVGMVGFNEDRLARVVPRVSGTVREVRKNVGDQVAAGEVLAVLGSKDIAEARSTYLSVRDKFALAEMTFNRENGLYKKNISSEQEIINARRELTQARNDLRIATQTLFAVGLGESDLQHLEAENVDLSRFEVVAPFAGEMVEKRIFVGEFLPQDRQIFVIADLSTVWVHLQVNLGKLADLSVGEPIRIVGNNGISAEAKIGYVAPVLSEETRAARARVDLENSDRHWRPGMTITGLVEGPAQPSAVVVPNDAVQIVDGRTSVFLPAPDGFRVLAVKIGRSDDKVTEVVQGLKAGDKIATGQTFVLKSELEKGAGDVD